MARFCGPEAEPSSATAGRAGPADVPRPALGALLGATAIVCAAFALCAVWAASAESRRAKALLDRVARAVKLYESDQGAPPAGDATGSAELLKTLCSGSRGRATYFEFQHQDLVDSEGHLVMPDGARVLYRGPLLSEGPSFELRVWSGGKWIAAP